MAREPYDIFIREFLQHPAWEEVIQKLESLAQEQKERLYLSSKDEHDNLKGRVEGVYEALSLVRGLIKQAKG